MNDLKKYLRRFSGKKMLVVGDLIVDEYIWGDVSRVSPEAPVPVVDVKSASFQPGGAAYVAKLVRHLGGSAWLTGIVGDDAWAGRLLGLLDEEGINIDGVVHDQSRPTTLKTRIIVRHQQISRIDREDRTHVSPATIKQLMEYLERVVKKVDGVIISDYAKGIMVPGLIKPLINLAKTSGKPVLVDPKPAHCLEFRNVTVITPNVHEAAAAARVEITDEKSLYRAGRKLVSRLNCAVLVTRGEGGMSLFETGGRISHIPTVAREVFDVTGAGDTVTSTMALALVSGASFRSAALLANYAAGVVVGKLGTATVTTDEIAEAIRKSPCRLKS